MARKPKDLYTVLQARRKVGKGTFRGRAAPGQRPQSLTEVLANWWASFLGRPRPAKNASTPAPRGILLSGPALAAIVFASLGVGFLLGDLVGGLGGGGQDSGTELRVGEGDDGKAEEQNGGIRPGPVGAGVRLSEVEETRILGDAALFLAAFRDDQRQPASAMAEWLRGEGIPTARIFKHWNDTGDGSANWVVVAYFEGPAPPVELVEKLRQMAGSDDHPQFDRTRKEMSDWPPAVPIR